jgi:hypothetical protein
MSPPPVRQCVLDMLGKDSDVDEDILEYIVSCLEDDTLEYGEKGEGIYDAVGMVMVRDSSNGERC